MSRYAAAHTTPQGPGDQRPTALQVIHDNELEAKLTGKVAVITGVSGGLGIGIVRALAATGVTLYLTARDIPKAEEALGDIFDRETMHLVQMDHTSLKSVRDAAATILAETSAANTGVNMLICNAAVMCLPNREVTGDGYEVQFQTNHLSHFLFFSLLKPAIVSAAATSPDFHSRVVMVSASGHRAHGLNPSDNYNFEKGGYHPWAAYAQSKTANIYMASEIERRFGRSGVHGLSLHPGIIGTGLSRFVPQEQVATMLSDENILRGLKSAEQGAATILYAAVDREWEGRGGRYLVDCGEAVRGDDNGEVADLTYVSYTYDEESEGRLWRDSERMVGIVGERDV
jgi:NAD(P)-dependent dehydrogenase (short-subunit alcohol dehydrogenase family)